MFKKKLLQNYLTEKLDESGNESLIFDGEKWTQSKIRHSDEDDHDNPPESELDNR